MCGLDSLDFVPVCQVGPSGLVSLWANRSSKFVRVQ